MLRPLITLVIGALFAACMALAALILVLQLPFVTPVSLAPPSWSKVLALVVFVVVYAGIIRIVVRGVRASTDSGTKT